jgi:hypothetical protein
MLAPDLGGSDGQHHPLSYDIQILILKVTTQVEALRSGNALGLGSVHG